MAKWGKKRKATGLAALDLPKHLAKGLAPCYLLLGGESFLQREALAAIQQAVLGEDGMGLTSFDGPKANLPEVLDELRTLPFLGLGRRLVLIRKADKTGPGRGKSFLAAHGEALAEFLAAPPEHATLVIQAGKVDKRLKASKALLAKVTEVACGGFDEAGLLRFLRQRAKHYGRPFAKGADLALLERLGGQEVALGQIDGEVKKLADAGEGPITPELIEALASSGSREQSFDLVDRIGRGDVEGALECLSRIYRDGLVSGEARTRDASGIAMILLPTIRWDMSRLIRGRTLLERGAKPFAITKELRVFRDKDRFLERVRRADPDALHRRHHLLRHADAALRNSGDPVGTLTDLVLALSLLERGPVKTGR